MNNAYGGWNVTTDRLIFANGQRKSRVNCYYVLSGSLRHPFYIAGDPWREATVAADGASFPKNDLQPHLLSDGFHCSDMLASEGKSKAVKEVQDEAVEYMTKWYADWKKTKA